MKKLYAVLLALLLSLGAITLLSSCSEQELTISNLRYDGQTLEWSEVNGARGYTVKVGELTLSAKRKDEKVFCEYACDESFSIVLQMLKANGTTFSYPFAFECIGQVTGFSVDGERLIWNGLAEAQDYVVFRDGEEFCTTTETSCEISKQTHSYVVRARKMQADENGNNPYFAVDSETFRFEKLNAPNAFSFDGEKLVWNEVDDAVAYELHISDNVIETAQTQYPIGGISSGEFIAHVRALGGNGYVDSEYSPTLTLYKLVPPTGVTVCDKVLSWSTVDRATGYAVCVGDEMYQTDETSFSLAEVLDKERTSFCVIAIGDGVSVCNSDRSESVTVYKHVAPTGLALQEGKLVWQGDAEKYTLSLTFASNTNEYTVFDACYDISGIAAGEYRVRIKAVGDNATTLDSSFSDTFTFLKLAAITSIRRNGDRYEWDAVDGASAYEISIGDSVIQTTETYYRPQFTATGTYEIGIRALSTSKSVLASEWYVETQTVKRLDKPVFDTWLAQDGSFFAELKNGELIVTVKKVTCATGYVCRINEKTYTSYSETEDSVCYRIMIETLGLSWAVQVRILSETFTRDGEYLLSSEYSEIFKIVHEIE